MILLGRKQLGDVIRFQIRTKNSSGVPTQPHSTGDSAPLLRVYSTSALVESSKFYLLQYPEETGVYVCDVALDGDYATGHYIAQATWSTGSGGFTGNESFQFQVVAGGSASGTVVAMEELDRTTTRIVVAEYDNGTVVAGRGAS